MDVEEEMEASALNAMQVLCFGVRGQDATRQTRCVGMYCAYRAEKLESSF